MALAFGPTTINPKTSPTQLKVKMLLSILLSHDETHWRNYPLKPKSFDTIMGTGGDMSMSLLRHIFSLSLLIMTSQVFYSIDSFAQSTLPINVDSCFTEYAVANTRFSDHLTRCLDELRGTPAGSNTVNNHLIDLRAQAASSPNSPILQIISERAASVYYENQHCGDDLRLANIPCNNLGALSRLHSSGMYRFNCDAFAATHAKCTEFSQIVIDLKRDFCNLNVINKNFCNRLILGFLQSAPCASSSTQAVCSAHINERINTDPCSIDNFDLELCTGSEGGSFGAAEVGGEEDPGAGGGAAGDDTTIDPTGEAPAGTTPEQTEQLAQTANQLGRQFFGGNNPMTAPSGNLNIPNSDARVGLSANADGSAVLGGSGVGTPKGIDQYPASALLPPQTMGVPGGSPKEGGGGGGGGPGGGMAPAMGGGANGGGGAGGGAKAGRGGYGTSRLKDILSKMNGGFLASTGTNAPAAGTAAVLKEDIKNKIKENQKNDPNYKNVINSAYRNGMGGSGQNVDFFDAVYFPSVRKAYEEIESSNQILQENGQ